MAEATPMMRQYLDLKSRHPDKILFFRLGDFYEMFQDDARLASTLLGLTLTQRQGEPMCGIPYHSSANYIRRLLEAGKCVAICEQVSEPTGGKGIVRREVVDILTPGTLVEDGYLGTSASNFTMVLHFGSPRASLAVADLSTGEFLATSFPLPSWKEPLERELERFRPREVLVSEDFLRENAGLRTLFSRYPSLVTTPVAPWHFDLRAGLRRLLDHFGVVSLKAFGLDDEAPEIVAAGTLLDYWTQNTPGRSLGHVSHLEVFQASEYLLLDSDSARSLELVANSRDGGKSFTLLEVLDHTLTAAGGRLLKSWLQFPLLNIAHVGRRQDQVAVLVSDGSLLGGARNALAGVLDLERLGARLSLDKASPRDLLGIGTSLIRADALAQVVEKHPEGNLFLVDWTAESRAFLTLEGTRIGGILVEDPPMVIHEGGLVRSGVSGELDELRHLRDHSQEVLEAYLAEEQQATGLTQMRLKHNRIIGHFFEISKSKLDQPPAHFERRQSLLGTERYSTPRLRELENTLQHAEERIFLLEKTIFLELRDRIKALLPALAQAGAFTSRVDVVASLAKAAVQGAYVRPMLTDSSDLMLIDARHPVVEASLQNTPFIPNSVDFDPGDTLFLITGPNMAGKSTYLRQTALIVLMAQTGSFVPAASARVGVVDRIYCRVGASDHLAQGESTFLVEMHETARILRGATPRSLVIMDEVGRGTSTRDGFSLAWAICEYLLDTVRAKTLFATHFHELTALDHSGLSNFSMAVEDDGQEVVFLRKVVPGASDNSYGLHVARLAGVPGSVVDRAARILEDLPPEQGLPGTVRAKTVQLDLFAEPLKPDLLRAELRLLDIDNLTPLQALAHLAKLKEISLS